MTIKFEKAKNWMMMKLNEKFNSMNYLKKYNKK